MINERLNALRQNMVKEGIDVYYFNTSDYHMSEYVANYFRTIKYFSGFTGSLATLLVDMKDAYIFVDGRYHIQADKQSGALGVKVIKLGTKGALEPLAFIKNNYQGKLVGLDGKRTSIDFGQKLEENGIKYKFYETKLNIDTAELARGFDGVCVFVNDNIDSDIILNSARIIFAKKEYSKFIVKIYFDMLFNQYRTSPQEVISLFEKDIEFLENLYLWFEENDNNHDYEGV